MNKLKALIHLVMVLTFGFQNASYGQTLYSASPTDIRIEKTTHFFVAYDFVQLSSKVDTLLPMKWKLESIENIPSEWTYTIQDPEQWYNGSSITEGSFLLKPNSDDFDKFITQIYPNQKAGEAIFTYSLYPISNPEDKTLMKFHFIITEVVTDIEYQNIEQTTWIIINQQKILIQEPLTSLKVFTIEGKLLQEFRGIGKNTFLELNQNCLTSRILLIHATKGSEFFTKKCVLY